MPPPIDPVTERVHGAAAGLNALLAEAAVARTARAEAGSAASDPAARRDVDGAGEGGSAVCAWNHFENIPTFYNWNNRPR